MKHMTTSTIFVFGGSSPISITCSQFLKDQGIRVVHYSRDPDQACFFNLKESGVTLRTIDFAKIMLDSSQLDELFSEMTNFKPNRILFSQRSKENDLESVLNSDVVAPSKILDLFSRSPSTRLKSAVILTSPASKFIQSSQPLSYHLSKTSQNQLARYFASNFQEYGIRVNCISPGAFVEKDRSKEFYGKNPEIVQKIENAIPLGRFASRIDIARLVNFLLSEDSGYINGASINIDGGLSLIDQTDFIV